MPTKRQLSVMLVLWAMASDKRTTVRMVTLGGLPTDLLIYRGTPIGLQGT